MILHFKADDPPAEAAAPRPPKRKQTTTTTTTATAQPIVKKGSFKVGNIIWVKMQRSGDPRSQYQCVKIGQKRDQNDPHPYKVKRLSPREGDAASEGEPFKYDPMDKSKNLISKKETRTMRHCKW